MTKFPMPCPKLGKSQVTLAIKPIPGWEQGTNEDNEDVSVVLTKSFPSPADFSFSYCISIIKDPARTLLDFKRTSAIPADRDLTEVDLIAAAKAIRGRIVIVEPSRTMSSYGSGENAALIIVRSNGRYEVVGVGELSMMAPYAEVIKYKCIV